MAKSKVMIDINSAEEREIVINVIKLIDSFSAALVNLTLNGICNATFTLAQSFSAFYNNIRILSEPDAAKTGFACHLRAYAKGHNVCA